jgi:hypothetical protein
VRRKIATGPATGIGGLVPEVIERACHPSEAGDPEAILRILSEHRRDVESGRSSRRGADRRRTTVLLGLVPAVALAVGGVLIWQHVAHQHSVSPHANVATLQTSTTPAAKKPAGGTAATKTRRPAVRLAGAAVWNRGLQPWGHSAARHLPNFYYAWVSGHVSCAAYATYGCWKVDVVTRHGCPRGVMVVAREMNGSADDGPIWGFSHRVAARSHVVVELDADRNRVSLRLGSVLCHPGS